VPVAGYAAMGGQLFRFDADPAGAHQVIAAECPLAPELEDARWPGRWPGASAAVLHLPKPSLERHTVVVTVLAPLLSPEPAGWIAHACKEIERVRGSLRLADKKALVAAL